MRPPLFLVVAAWCNLGALASAEQVAPVQIDIPSPCIIDMEPIMDLNLTVAALTMGIRHFQIVSLYGKHHISDALQQVPRNELFITTKVGYFPPSLKLPAALDWAIPKQPRVMFFGQKGDDKKYYRGHELEQIKDLISETGLGYLDLCLAHVPWTTVLSMWAAFSGSFWFMLMGVPWPLTLPLKFITRALATIFPDDPQAAAAERRRHWMALEDAKRQGLCRHIGLGAHPLEYILETDSYRTEPIAAVWNAMSPLDPDTRGILEYARRTGLRPIHMGFQAKAISEHSTIKGIAARMGVDPVVVVDLWLLQHGVVLNAPAGLMKEYVDGIEASRRGEVKLSEEDMRILDEIPDRTTTAFYLDTLPPAVYGKEGSDSRTEL